MAITQIGPDDYTKDEKMLKLTDQFCLFGNFT